MGVSSYRPYTPTKRYATVSNFTELSKKRPEKSLIEIKKSSGGRNNYGRVTSRFRGGGHKRFYRIVDFARCKKNIEGVVTAFEYDPNRSARLALITYKDGEKRYILAPVGLSIGSKVIASENADIQIGNCLPLKNIPPGTNLHNIELKPGSGGKVARSAGAAVQLLGFESDYAQLRNPSGEIRIVSKNCWASIGQVGNLDHENLVIGKAGKSRWLGFRPHNRGVSMNPVDHPMGGGEGKSSGGRHPVSPWGQKAKGKHTRNNKRTNRFIVRRRK